MSTRWYPLYNRGNPQLRVFLPNFWMKLVKPTKKLPSNMVTFQTSLEMTHHDVKNYLEKIYKIQIVEARVEIVQGKTKQSEKGYVIKEDDYKIATITLPKEDSFEFPDLAPKKTMKDEMKQLEDAQKQHEKYVKRNLHRPGVPGWFSF